MNLNTFSERSEENRAILMEIAAEAVDYQRNLAIYGEEEMLKTLSAHMGINNNVNSAAFQEAACPAWVQFVESYGSEIIDAILKASNAQ